MSKKDQPKSKCTHSEVELLGEQKAERGTNRYYKCLKCGDVLVLSEDGTLYEIPAAKAEEITKNLRRKQP
ncbi:hypothetical protein H5T51_05600 [Candidatus Bathyarchaeota archaeon]|nr:hypothetical protein [Candidatus Bathyarchaeota archaeon]